MATDAEFKALVRELKEVKRTHDALGDRIGDIEERLAAAQVVPDPPAKKGDEGESFLGIKG